MLYLKNRNPEKFDTIRQQKGEKILPIEMVDPFTKFYQPPNVNRKESVKGSNANEEIKEDEVEMEFDDKDPNLNMNERIKPVINKFDDNWVPGGKYASVSLDEV